MSKIFTILFILITVSILHSYTIEETLQQIKSLEKEIERNEILVEEKIEELEKNNPLFADQDVFESDIEYLARMNKTIPLINKLRKQYLDELCQKMSNLHGRLFKTNNIQIEIDKKNYNPEKEEWEITIKHLEYQKENIQIILNISKDDASDLYKNWDKVKKTGILTIDIGDKIGFAKLILENPITGFKYDYKFFTFEAFKHGGEVNSVAFSPNGKFLATGTRSNYANIINLNSGKFESEFRHNGDVNSVVFSPNGNFLATGSDDLYARIFNIDMNVKEKSYKHWRYVNSVSFSPDGKFLATSTREYSHGSYSGNASIFNLNTDNEIKSFKHGGGTHSITFSSNGKFVAVGCDGYARIYNKVTGKEVISFNRIGQVNSVVFSPDSKYLAVGAGHTARIFNIKMGNEVKSFKHEGGVYSVAFSPDGKYLATGAGAYDNSARIFNIETGLELKSYKHNEMVNSVAFSPDSRYLAIACWDNYAYIYRTLLQTEEIELEPVKTPPALIANVNFYEPSENQYLDALEKGEIKLVINNTGKGPAKGISIKFKPENIEELNYNNSYIEEIPAGESVTISIPIEAYIDIKDQTHLLRINFEEINGFPPAPVEIQISTKSYEKPEMFIADVGIQDGNNDGKIESGEMIELTLRFANQGKGIVSGAYAKFYSGDNVFITDAFPKTVELDDLEYGEFIDINLEFFVNDRTVEEIPLFVDITESTGLATINKLRIPILKSDKTRKIQRTVVTGIDKEFSDLEFGEDLSIDIEENIPSGLKKNDNILAVIFGIEDYKNVSDVSFAHRDASFIKEYFSKTLGVKENNIYYKTNEDVGKAEFDKVFSAGGWLDKRVKKGKTEIYFYYAGHGSPDIKENKAYLIPYDGDPNYASQTGYEMEEIYDTLANLNAKSVTVFLDACFTGANRESEMLLANARPLMIEVESPIAKGITVFSATGQKEISSAWPEKKHGLFSYFLMKGMQGDADANRDSKLSLKELGDYIQYKVSEQAGYLDREQTPQMISNDESRILIDY